VFDLFVFIFYFLVFSNSSLIIGVFLSVVSSIVFFANWYLSVNFRIFIFYLQFVTFQLAMVFLIDCNHFYFLILGWEIIGVFSYFLIISFNSRSIAQNRSMLAFLVNRVGDFFLFMWIVCEISFLLSVAILTKSSLTLFCNWLPNAIEGPTPVSSLLHSSTIVVARVFILSFLGVSSCFLLFAVIFFRVYCRFFGKYIKDYKRTVAFSTSSQLSLIRVFWLVGRFFLSIFYVFTHALFKAIIFIVVGFLIHMTDSQLFIGNAFFIFWINLSFGCLVMLGLPFLSVAAGKDTIVLRFSIIWTIFVVWSTIFYSLGLFIVASSFLSLSCSRVLCIFTSLLSFSAFFRFIPLDLSIDFFLFVFILVLFFNTYLYFSILSLFSVSNDSKKSVGFPFSVGSFSLRFFYFSNFSNSSLIIGVFLSVVSSIVFANWYLSVNF